MFYKSVKAAWDTGKVHIGLPAFGFREPTIAGRGLGYAFKVFLLSGTERQTLIKLAEYEAACVAGVVGDVDDWTPDQREMVRRSVLKFGFPKFPVSQRSLEGSTPQRRLLLWEGQKLAKRLPHKPFRFEASTFVNSTKAETDNGDFDADLRDQVVQLRNLHPEIAHWGDIALVFAWSDYSQDCWMNSWHFIEGRNENFLNYLCWKQTRGEYPRGAGDEIADEADEWKICS
jgi:hypothetical protein